MDQLMDALMNGITDERTDGLMDALMNGPQL